MAGLLPAGFAGLEGFAAEWVLPDAVARMQKRQASTMPALKAFYAAMLAHGAAALDHLRGFALGELPVESAHLLKLMLALAEVAPAVEWYGSPRVTDGFAVERIRYLRQISDTDSQGVSA